MPRALKRPVVIDLTPQVYYLSTSVVATATTVARVASTRRIAKSNTQRDPVVIDLTPQVYYVSVNIASAANDDKQTKRRRKTTVVAIPMELQTIVNDPSLRFGWTRVV